MTYAMETEDFDYNNNYQVEEQQDNKQMMEEEQNPPEEEQNANHFDKWLDEQYGDLQEETYYGDY